MAPNNLLYYYFLVKKAENDYTSCMDYKVNGLT